MPRIAVAFLVDPRGHVLLQHRDEHAPQAANQWGMVGGHVEPEEDFDTAVHREILEETGISTGPGDLVLWQEPSSRTPTGTAALPGVRRPGGSDR